MINEQEAHTKLVNELNRMRPVAENLGPAFADAAANIRRFLDAWESFAPDVGIVASLWTSPHDNGNDEGVVLRVADLRALIDERSDTVGSERDGATNS